MVESEEESSTTKYRSQSKSRLDKLVMNIGLADNIQRAQSLILAGSILVDDRVETRVGISISPSSVIRLKEKIKEYVSRGAYKLLGAFDSFNLHVEGRIALDLGSSTGGFTQVLLEKGVAKVVAIDVGYGQLAGRLRNDPRVIVLDRFHINRLSWSILEPLVGCQKIDHKEELNLFIVSDLSFISIRSVFEILKSLMDERKNVFIEGIILIKPQFETQNPHLLNKGILMDSVEHGRILRSVLRFFRSRTGGTIQGLKNSPILGMDGNKEFLFHFTIG